MRREAIEYLGRVRMALLDDVVEATLIAAVSESADGQIFNLGGDEPTSLKDLIELMIEINGSGSYRLVPFPAEKKAIDIGDFYGDYTRIRSQLGWQPKIKLREGLQKTIGYYKENLSWYK